MNRRNVLLSYILIIVQRDATQSSLIIILQVHSTCFRCQTPITRGTQNCNYSLRYCSCLPPTWQSRIILEVHSTCFGCQSHLSSGVHKTVTTAYGTAATSLQRGNYVLFCKFTLHVSGVNHTHH